MLTHKQGIDMTVKPVNVIGGIKILCNACLICDDNHQISFFLESGNRLVRIRQEFKILNAVKMTRINVYRAVSVKKNGASFSS
jgi:hypothetical protein